MQNTNNILTENKIYKACIYLRLSKEDGDKEESNSISNQRDILVDYINSQPNIELVSERVDDGVSGATFDRPSFKQMIDDISNGDVDCVIVKDLSRFGRNYTESGKYIERIFPLYNIRFIAVNQNIDSINNDYKDSIMISFLNLMNDTFCRDTSIKIKKQLKSLRERGELSPSNLPYGFIKNDKKEIIVDEYASQIVAKIFNWKIEGYNQQQIANKLNEQGILSPLDYKMSKNPRYTQKSDKSSWTSSTVRRILKNEFYNGTLVLGKQTTPNHKVKKKVNIPEENWVKTENNHTPIISKDDFNLVTNLMNTDSRVSASSKLDLFSCLLYCADCGEHLIKNTVHQKGKVYEYYICSRNRTTKDCTSHRITSNKLYDLVLGTIQGHIEYGLRFENILEFINEIPSYQDEVDRINTEIATTQNQIIEYTKLKDLLHNKLDSKIINEKDYSNMSKAYDFKIQQANNTIQTYIVNRSKLELNLDKYTDWVEYLKSNQNIEKLDRVLLLTLIDKIIVQEDKNIRIFFKFNLSYDAIIKELVNYYKSNNLPLPIELSEVV